MPEMLRTKKETSVDINKTESWFKELGWHFDEKGDFVDKNGKLFDFSTQEEHYEFVQEHIKRFIYSELTTRFQFVQYPVPILKSAPRRKDDPHCPQVFVTRDVLLNPNLLVIVQGMGEVPPGQWARKLFTNGKRKQFRLGSQFSYIQRALHLGWAVILCDPNHDDKRPRTAVTRARHVRRVWEDIVSTTIHTACEGYCPVRWGQWTLKIWDAIWQMAKGASDHDSVPGSAVGQVFEYLMECQSWFEATLTKKEFEAQRRSYVKGKNVSQTAGGLYGEEEEGGDDEIDQKDEDEMVEEETMDMDEGEWEDEE
ncbi:hypothetical protein BGW38_008021 [Lunasporangiospora selenospora]|uniref:Arb2 domain-containing protein n=1 Tax=Lunasporangiospora selenospora TaxID=979761 RepID=A0A9P6KIK8_9FUNG|nr:hypothetical protein BGW38_008021 [Lunasporangiospora selenospora]